MLSILIFPIMIITIPTEKPNFSKVDINIPNIIDLNVDKHDIVEFDDIEQSIMNVLNKNNDKDNTLFLMLDKYYYKANYSDFERFLYINVWTHRGDYILSFNDCDDYSFKIYGMFCQDDWSGLPVGVILWSTPKHADPFFVDETMTPYVIVDYNKIVPLLEYQKSDYKVNIIII